MTTAYTSEGERTIPAYWLEADGEQFAVSRETYLLFLALREMVHDEVAKALAAEMDPQRIRFRSSS